MRRFLLVLLCAMLAQSGAPEIASAKDKLADVVKAETSLTANGGSLLPGEFVFEQDRLSTNGTGRGELLFVDGTKLALGPSSSLTVSQSVMRGRNRFSKLGIRALRGSFRWISGSSGSAAYALATPRSTIGIRGTALDITIRGGKTYVALLNGRARICGGGDCQVLSRTCDYVEVGGKISRTKQISAGFKSRRQAADIFPYMANPGLLSSRFRVGGRSCLSPLALNSRSATPAVAAAADQPTQPPPPPPPHTAGGKDCNTNCGKGKGNGGPGNGTGNEGKGKGHDHGHGN